MNLRRSAAALAAATVLGMAAVPAASADTPLPPGLYGTGDPTYDGVWRQSYALLALDTAGVKPADSAVAWLTGQQCADGGFPSYRADTSKACDAKTEDTNATGIAVQALTALGDKATTDTVVKKATDWLTSVRNKDGGWSYNPGGASDPNSTGVVIGAQSAVREASDSLKAFQFGCDAKAADRGAFGYPMNGKLTVNAKATADAVRGAHGAGFVVAPSTTNVVATAPDCASPDAYKKLDADGAASAGGAYLTTQLTAGGGHLTAVTPGADKPTPDYGTTADAVIALAAIHQRDTAKTSYDWLAKNSATWSKGNPAALSQLILAAHATGNDPRSAGGADLVQQLTNLGPKPAAAASASPSPSDRTEKKDDKSSSATWWIVGVFFVASIGVGFLVSGRKKKQG